MQNNLERVCGRKFMYGNAFEVVGRFYEQRIFFSSGIMC